ncbi:MAG: hypothetical protein IPH57_15415 [Saprospiraceae bacterium]|nr:hypothetical protein [Saprospiraceae bacterium]
MFFKILLILFSISILPSDFSFAQEPIEKKDSTRIYKNIEAFAKRRKFTNFMYRLVFKPVAVSTKTNNEKKKKSKPLVQKQYRTFEGKIIRNINIETLDPFGYSVTDTGIISQNYLARAGNNLHLKSQRITIRNLLLIRQNQVFDSLLVKESERLVRKQSYVHDVSFLVIATSKNSDSVDIFIRELDNWSIAANVGISNSNISIQLTDKNILGLGHELKPGFDWLHKTGDYAYNANYYIPNIRNTYINTTLHYSMDEFKNSNKIFSIDRPFFSSYAKWAAGMNFMQQFYRDSLHSADSVSVLQRFKMNTQDYWVGNATRIFKGQSENSRTTNLISAVRYYTVHFLEKPLMEFDTLHLFSDENFYMASIGISTRKYVQDKYIFKFGKTEDVPIGMVFNITGGFQMKNNINRLYLGMRFSSGNHYKWGYLSYSFEYSTFFHSSHTEQGEIKVSMNYFTELFSIGKWRFRQFVKPQVTYGIHRFSYESLTINDGFGIDGFNSVSLTGTNRILFTFQTQSYAPWNILGFRFGPYFIYSIGMLSNSNSGFKNNKMYSLIGLGVLIKNESLVFSTFQFSISFYPTIPGRGSDVFKINSFKTTDFGFQDFEIGKPTTIVYQ